MKKIQLPLPTVQAVLIGALIIGAFFMGSLWTKVKLLEKGSTTATTQPAAAQGAAQPKAKPTINLTQVTDAFNKSFIKFGDAKKKVTIIEISDPSCPYCQIAAGKNPALNNQSDQFKLVADGGTYVAPVPEIRKLVDSGKASYALVYYPGHGSGEMGAKALYCGFENKKFWEVHDTLMTDAGYNLLNNTIKNDKTKSGDLAEFLAGAMNADTMKKCLDNAKGDTQLAADQAIARGLNVGGTPGFFINSTPFPGAYSFTDMKPVVDAAL